MRSTGKFKIAIIGQGVVGRAFKRLVGRHYPTVTYDPLLNKKYPQKAINKCDLGVICVPTNSLPDGACDTSLVETAVRRLNTPLILIKSTIEPGTTDRLKQATNKRICFSPEYIGESSYYHPYWLEMVETPYLIVGGDKPDCAAVIDILEPILGPTKTYFTCPALEAELVKYMGNSFFAAKVTFVNEFFNICRALGADWHTVREGWLLDPRINKMHTSVFKHKRGFGGKCFPKDLKAIVARSLRAKYIPRLLRQVLKSNADFTR